MSTANATPAEEKLPWSPITAIAITVAVYFASQFIGGILLYTILSVFGWDRAQITSWFDSGTVSSFIVVAIIELVTFLLIYGFIRYRKSGMRALGITHLKLAHIGYAVAGFAAYFPLYIVSLTAIRAIVPSLDVNQRQQLDFQAATSRPELVLVFIALVVVPPLLEEIIYRGFLFGGLRTKLPVIVATVMTSLLFATPHLQIGSGKPPLWVAFIDTFVLSMVLVYLRVKSGSLWPSIGLHAIKNGVAFVALFILGVS